MFLFVCVRAFLLSTLLGSVPGWECVIMPQGHGGFEEVKHVLRYGGGRFLGIPGALLLWPCQGEVWRGPD